MPKFCVALERTLIQYNYVVIEAEDEAAAREKYVRLVEFPHGFDDRWENSKYHSEMTISEDRLGHLQIRRAKDCQRDNYHDHFEDDLEEDYFMSYSLPDDPDRHHIVITADDYELAEDKLLDLIPDAKDIYIEELESQYEKFLESGPEEDTDE